MMGGISLWQLLIIFGIVILLFGTHKLRHLGSDLGNAVKGFKTAINDKEQEEEDESNKPGQDKNISRNSKTDQE